LAQLERNPSRFQSLDVGLSAQPKCTIKLDPDAHGCLHTASSGDLCATIKSLVNVNSYDCEATSRLESSHVENGHHFSDIKLSVFSGSSEFEWQAKTDKHFAPAHLRFIEQVSYIESEIDLHFDNLSDNIAPQQDSNSLLGKPQNPPHIANREDNATSFRCIELAGLSVLPAIELDHNVCQKIVLCRIGSS
jgi:hypothetical protein